MSSYVILASPDMSNLLVLPWARPIGGYQISDDGDRLDPVSQEPDHYQPLEGFPALFQIFADTRLNAVGVCDFVTRFGPLYSNVEGPTIDLSPFGWREYVRHIREMRTAIKKWKNGDIGWICHMLDAYERGNCKARLYAPDRDSTPQIFLTPDSLLSAMWLQLALAIAGGVKTRKCDWCGTWWVHGTGTRRRKSGRFCSDNCRKAAHKHSKEKSK